ncbi:MAG: aminoglycoside phosphotransferase family protein [Candidatus Pacearchaeota archaeon]|jgi:hypothetical protein
MAERNSGSSLEELIGVSDIDFDLKQQLSDLGKQRNLLIFMRDKKKYVDKSGVKSIQDGYDRLSKLTASNRGLSIYCLEQKLEFMHEFEDLHSWKFLGIRAETNFNVGVKKEVPGEKKKHFVLAYQDLEREVEQLRNSGLNNPLNAALYKTIEVCSSLSGYLNDPVNERDLKLQVVQRGLDSIKELRDSRSLDYDFRARYMHSFLCLRKSEVVEEGKRDIYDEGITLLKDAFKSARPFEIDRTISSYASQAFSDRRGIGTGQEYSDKTNLTDLENLVFATICSELSEQMGNHKHENYQAIARDYYELQHLIKRVYKKQNRTIALEDVEEKIKGVLNLTNPLGEKVFGAYRGGLLQIIDKTVAPENNSYMMRGIEMQSISLEHALSAFEKSREAFDESSDNLSYTGFGITNLATLNQLSGRISREEMEKRLIYAESLLERVLETRKEEKSKDLYKDYTRLAECQFRLAGLTVDISAKKGLYRKVISNNLKAARLFNTNPLPEFFSYIASSFFKSSEVSFDSNLRTRYLRKATRYLDRAYEAGDKSVENRAKKGFCSLKLLEDMSIKGNTASEEVDALVMQSKQSFEEAIQLAEPQGRGLTKNLDVYSYFLFYYLSKAVCENRISGGDLNKYQLREPAEYVKDAFDLFFTRPALDLKQISEGSNLVCKSLDDHGLLNNIFVLKKGKRISLDKEMEITSELNQRLLGRFGENKKYLVPRPHGIFFHEDNNPDFTGDYYVMSYKEGNTLERILKDERKGEEQRLGVLLDVTDYLAFIHAEVPINDKDFRFDRGRSDISLRLQRFKKSELRFTSRDIENILSNYSVIEESLKDSLLVFNKDAHPRNWIIRSNQDVVALDFEGGVIPQAYDLVKLMESGTIPLDKRDELIQHYVDRYREYSSGQNLDFDKFKPQYFNLILHKALAFIGGWSKQKSDEWNRNIVLAVENAQKSVAYIQANLSSDPRYKTLESSFDNLHRLLVAA